MRISNLVLAIVVCTTGCKGLNDGRTEKEAETSAAGTANQADWINLNGEELELFFLERAPREWQNYQEQLSRVRIKFDGHGPGFPWQAELVQYEGCRLLRIPRSITWSRDTIFGRNLDYQFQLIRDPDHWQLHACHRLNARLDPESHDSTEIDFDHFLEGESNLILNRPMCIHDVPLHILVLSNEVVIEDVSKVVEGNQTLVRVDFSGNFIGQEVDLKLRGDPVASCYAILDPENYWLVEKAAVYDKDNVGLVAEHHYDYDSNEVPVITSYYTIWDYNEAGGGWMEGPRIRNYEVTLDDVAESGFRLSDYGLPEPDWKD